MRKGKIRVHSSGFNTANKEKLVQDVQKLGGIYEEHLTFNTNYLICDSVLSNKYRVILFLKNFLGKKAR